MSMRAVELILLEEGNQCTLYSINLTHKMPQRMNASIINS